MTTTYRFAVPVVCPFSERMHLPAGNGHDGHLLVFDEENRTLQFVNARNGVSVAGRALLDDKTLPAAKDWIAQQVAAKALVRVEQAAAPAPSAPPALPAAPALPSGDSSGASGTSSVSAVVASESKSTK